MKTQWIPGAVSATFKKMPLTADEVIALLAECGLKAVEWSENVHVQPDDPDGAALLRQKTEAAGLRVAAYGSYFRLGENAGAVQCKGEQTDDYLFHDSMLIIHIQGKR